MCKCDMLALYHQPMLDDFRNDMFFTCNLTKSDKDYMDLSGVLTLKGKVFALNGRFLMSDESPVSGQIQLEPEGVNETVIFKYEIQRQASGYALKAKFLRKNGYAELEAHSTARHTFDWDLQLQVR